VQLKGLYLAKDLEMASENNDKLFSNRSSSIIGYAFGFIVSIMGMYRFIYGTFPQYNSSISSKQVDGYKDFKFGMSLDQLKALKPCSLGKARKAEGMSRLRYYSCENFEFNSQPTLANFFFVDDELLRVAFLVGTTMSQGYALIKPLNEKYGPPSTYDEELAKAFDQERSNKLEAAWASNSVVLSFSRKGNGILITIVYSSDNYQTRALSGSQRALSNDL
jgi:hypothetical protein